MNKRIFIKSIFIIFISLIFIHTKVVASSIRDSEYMISAEKSSDVISLENTEENICKDDQLDNFREFTSKDVDFKSEYDDENIKISKNREVKEITKETELDDFENVEEKVNVYDHIAYIEGYEDGTVRPEENITREEVAAIIYRRLDFQYKEYIKTNEHSFIDLKNNAWALEPIASLKSGGLLDGYQDNTFRPKRNMTRGEIAAVLVRFDEIEDVKENKFKDIKGHWAENYINIIVDKGWMNGYEDGTFKPNDYITRAEFIKVYNCVLMRGTNKSNMLPNKKEFSDLDEDKWYYEDVQEALNSHRYILTDGMEKWIEIIE